MKERTYLAIDLKSFYASVECVQRGLDPMTTHLVVADKSRTEKTICLAVSPSLKAYGIPGRARLFQVAQRVREINAARRERAPGHRFTGSSFSAPKLQASPSLELDYLTAPPRMALYMEYSARIYDIYLRYASPEDIHVYSIDEVFLDITSYLPASGRSAREFARAILLDIRRMSGITAAAGIGTNLYLCKVALDILAKHVEPDAWGARIAELDEQSYRRKLWAHQPLSDFWRVGWGTAEKLKRCGLLTMGDIARCSLGGSRDFHNEELLYRLFGVNAELLIDHAWGWESCTLADIKAYHPRSSSVGSGQVLPRPYSCKQARLVLQEMADALSLELAAQGLMADQLVLTVGYDIENLLHDRKAAYRGEITRDHYGRAVPRHAHGTAPLGSYTASSARILKAAAELFDRIVDPSLLVRRITLNAGHVLPQKEAADRNAYEQLCLFPEPSSSGKSSGAGGISPDRERRWQETLIKIREKYGKGAVLRGMSLQEGATARERSRQIGGHRV